MTTSTDTSKVLVDYTIYLAKKQFPTWAEETFTTIIHDLGGQITENRNECTYILVNPHSANYANEVENHKLQKTEHLSTRPALVPYHWLTTSHLLSKAVSITSLSPKPIFVHPSTADDHRPLRLWVSINIARKDADESPEQAQKLIEKLSITNGGILVKRRASADVLIVNRNTQFYAVVKEERKKGGRDWQKLAERGWVEECCKRGVVIWDTGIGQEGEDGDNEDELDSMAEEEDVGAGKKVGRPAGKPRIDYTPEDDDFLCRYLAAFQSGGSWGSRKTYATMVDAKARFPVADRHSHQSWHQRFKSNSVVFENRIKRLLSAGIDTSLKTAAEREKARANTLAAHSSEVSVGEAGPSRTTAATKTEIPNPDVKAKRKLVELEDDLFPPTNGSSPKPLNTVNKKPNKASSSTAGIEATTSSSKVPPPSPSTTNRRSPAISAPKPAKTPVEFESLLPDTQQVQGSTIPSTAKQNVLDEDDAAVEKAMFGSQPGTSQSQSQSQSQTQSYPVNGDDKDSQSTTGGGEETQAILSNFNQARVESTAFKSGLPVSNTRSRPPSPKQPGTPGKVKVVRMEVDDSSRSRHPASPSKRARESSLPILKSPDPLPHRNIQDITRPASELISFAGAKSPILPHRDVQNITRPASELIHPILRNPQSPGPGPGPSSSTTNIASTPSHTHNPTQPSNPLTSLKDEVQGTPLPSHLTNSAGKYSTPTNAYAENKRGYSSPLLREAALQSSAKRLRSMEKAALKNGSSSKKGTPDLVLVNRSTRFVSNVGSPTPSALASEHPLPTAQSTSAPPHALSTAPASASTPAPPLPTQTQPQPAPAPARPLTDEEHYQAVQAGHKLIQDVQAEYRARIVKYSERYGVLPTEVVKILNGLPKNRKGGGGGQLYWTDIEEGLKGIYGF